MSPTPTAAAVAAKTAPTTKAMWYPPTSASSWPCPLARRLSEREAQGWRGRPAERAAHHERSVDDARGESRSSGATSLMAASSTGLNADARAIRAGACSEAHRRRSCTDRRPREEREPDGREQQAGGERRLCRSA